MTARKPRIGEVLLANGRIGQEAVPRIAAAQRAKEMRFGEAAVDLGLVTNDELQEALARQFDYPYVSSTDSALDRRLFVAFEPFGARAEAVRSIRTQLLARWIRERRKTIALATARAGDHGARVAANLAIAFAQLGQRTLVIEADFRAPQLDRLLGLNTREGLSSVLAGRRRAADLFESVRPFEELRALPAGAPPPNPQELLARSGFAEMLEECRADFDVVLITLPAVLEFADAQVVAGHIGSWIQATARNKTLISDVQRAKAAMERTGAVHLGAVITD